MVPSEVLQFLREGRRFLISSHLNPDGDGLGSVMAIKWALNALGKESDIIVDSDPPDMFGFFKNYQWVRRLSAEIKDGVKYRTAVLVDCPSAERSGDVATLLADGARTLIIDHHVSNELYGTVNYLDESAASSTEIIYRIIKALDMAVDEECAEYLYTGLIVDTGRFRFSNTSPEALRVGSELVAAGVQPSRITERIYFHNTFETTKALGRFIDSIRLHCGGSVTTAQFDHEYLASDHYQKVDTEGFVNHALAIRGVEVAMFLREVEPGVTRASLRSKTGFDVNRLAHCFGGGGHAKAAGCTIRKPIEEAKAVLLAEVEKTLSPSGPKS